ncbi:PucR family transcriptional regulator [Paenibacillus assamensis]|uniref:PucR family transcriptional regulator n=1 Tax=Paenibacillus assamensis TaxID=311244 RepID=UPI000407F963|nr:helix-turn-helix domain-containing protein [Paenibacillus assamensis]
MMIEKPSLHLHIERILGRTLEKISVPTSLWKEWTQPFTRDVHLIGPSVVVMHHNDGDWYLLWEMGSEQSTLMKLESSPLSIQEQQWIELVLMLEHGEKLEQDMLTVSEEQEAEQVGSWILSAIHERDWKVEIPEHIPWSKQLSGMVTPFLLVTEHIHREGPRYQLLKKLVDSYFDGHTFLIPLTEQEWLILVPSSLTVTELDDDAGSDETQEELLTSYCLGLYELLTAEWIGESHMTVNYSFIGQKGIPATVAHMRESVFLGRTFHVTEHIHLPWELHIEHLAYSIPDHVRAEYLKRIVKKTEVFHDAETMATLEMFFQQNCSVSETAKRLYIHRNTLLYRLDKIKQETGLDIRSFSDAVLIKLVLLLYKVAHQQ